MEVCFTRSCRSLRVLKFCDRAAVSLWFRRVEHMAGMEEKQRSRWIRRPLGEIEGVDVRTKGNYRFLYHALPKPDLVTAMRGMISEGRELDAYEMFATMKENRQKPAREAYHALLDLCIKHGDVEAARIAFDDMRRVGYQASQMSLVKVACVYLRAELVTDVLHFLKSLEKELDVKVVRETFIHLMKWSNKCGMSSTALRIYDAASHWNIHLQHHSDLVFEQIKAISCFKDVDHLRAIEQKLQLRRFDPKVWSALAIAYADNGLPSCALAQMERMIAVNYVPALECSGAVLSACLATKDLDTACKVLSLLKGHRHHTFSYDRYAPRYYNALLELQIAAHEVVRLAGRRSSGQRQLLSQLLHPNHYRGMKVTSRHMIPDSKTFEALLYLGIIRSDYDGAASEVLTTLIECGCTPPSSSFVSWSERVTHLSLDQATVAAKKTLNFIERARVNPTLAEWCQLMSVALKMNEKPRGHSEEQAAAYVGLINGYMTSHGILHSAESNDIMLRILAKTGAIGPLLHRLRVMGDEGEQPTKETFATVVDGLWKANQPLTAKAAVYNVWSMTMKLGVDPSLETVNKLILCCGQCGQLDRAFYFFDVLSNLNLEAGVETFNALIKVCLMLKRSDKADKVFDLMQHKGVTGTVETRR